MGIQRFYYCAVAGIIIATLMALSFGASGLSSYNDLKNHERYLLSSIMEMEDSNRILEQRVKMLKVEPEIVRLLSRETGHYRNNEMVLNLVSEHNTFERLDYSSLYKESSAVGPLFRPGLPASRDSFNVLAVGLLIGTGLFFIVTVVMSKREKYSGYDNFPKTDVIPEGQFSNATRVSKETRSNATSQTKRSTRFRYKDSQAGTQDIDTSIQPENKMRVIPRSRWPWIRHRQGQDIAIYRL